MKFQFRGKNIQVTDALKERVEKKLGKLDKYFDTPPEAIVTLSVEKERHRVEVTIPLNGYILRGEEETNDMYSSVDQVVEKLEKQMEKYRTRLSKRNKGASIKDIAASFVERTAVEEDPRLVRTKRFALKPMSVEEAILQMNLLGHSFFVFSNAENEEVNVVYRRKDGNYGLIEREN
ncbi:MAG: ribosome-associated translation inhibitor RaiA [Clostridia bacterium]|nr:ribosome-associated translation inhibitor RaiA [Clostridia bacterium]MDD4665867.1 ribosome-associated translation inhibitor RaiA [Clostridia bacterium]